MRSLTTHHIAGTESTNFNALNDAITIDVLDEPGHGGACHTYSIIAIDPKLYEPDGTLDIEKTAALRAGCTIQFQKGPIAEAGVNGISNEALLAVLIDRLEGFQSGQYACSDNQWALSHLQDAMQHLQKRTRERIARGVEGTSTI